MQIRQQFLRAQVRRPAQNSLTVTAVQPLPADFVAVQLDAVLSDYGTAILCYNTWHSGLKIWRRKASITIVIRDLDEATAAWIDKTAKQRNLSIEAIVIELIRLGIDLKRRERSLLTHDDLDHLAGTWSDEEADEFLATIADFNQVDELLWK